MHAAACASKGVRHGRIALHTLLSGRTKCAHSPSASQPLWPAPIAEFRRYQARSRNCAGSQMLNKIARDSACSRAVLRMWHSLCAQGTAWLGATWWGQPSYSAQLNNRNAECAEHASNLLHRVPPFGAGDPHAGCSHTAGNPRLGQPVPLRELQHVSPAVRISCSARRFQSAGNTSGDVHRTTCPLFGTAGGTRPPVL